MHQVSLNITQRLILIHSMGSRVVIDFAEGDGVGHSHPENGQKIPVNPVNPV